MEAMIFCLAMSLILCLGGGMLVRKLAERTEEFAQTSKANRTRSRATPHSKW